MSLEVVTSSAGRFRYSTPEQYAAAARAFGTEQAYRAAELAAQAANAAQRGDLYGARAALRGLALADAAADDERLILSIASSIGNDAQTRRIAQIVQTIQPIVGGIIDLIAGATGDAGVREAAGWFRTFLDGRVPSSASPSTIRSIADFCRAKPIWFTGLSETIRGIASLANASADVQSGINTFLDWLDLATTRLCNSAPVQAILNPPPPPAPPTPRPATPQSAAINNWRNAVMTRIGVELALDRCERNELSASVCQSNRTRDQQTSDALFAAETEYLRLFPGGIPQWGGGTLMAPASGAARRFVRRPVGVSGAYWDEALRARPSGTTPPSTGGGGGAAVAAAAAIPLIAYFLL